MKKNAQKHKLNKSISIVLVSLSLAILVVVGLGMFSNGKTTTSGNIIANRKNEYLACDAVGAKYPKLIDNRALSGEIRVTLVFNSDELSTIGLIHTLYYSDTDNAKRGETILHAKLNKDLAVSGLKESALNNKFNVYEDRLILNLFANIDDISLKTAQYFLIETNNENITNWTREDYYSNYIEQGFNCRKS